MNVGELRLLISSLPDDMEVMLELDFQPEDEIIQHPIDGGEVDELHGVKSLFLMTVVDEEEDDEEDEEDEKTLPEQ